MRSALLVAGVLLTTACCPLPWHRRVLEQPEGTFHVVDATTSAPIAGATVTVRRYNIGPPPRRVTNTWTEPTSSGGVARFSMTSRGEWVMPLMMHGVPQWGWKVCVAAPGHAPVEATWIVQRAWSNPKEDGLAARDVVVSLPVGKGEACADDTSLFEEYPASVTGTDERWKTQPPFDSKPAK